MFWIALLIALASAGWLIAVKSNDRLWGVVGLLVAAIFMVGASAHIVPTRNVGIVTQFNKPTGDTTGAGLVWTAPWESVDEWDASGNTYDRLGDKCLWVSIAAQRTACIAVQIEWNAKADGASAAWAAYKKTKIGDKDFTRFETFVYRRINPQIDGVITSAFASFDPLGKALPKGETDDPPAPDLNALYKAEVLRALNTAVGNDIEIRSLAFAKPTYDKVTEAAIASYGQKRLDARNLAEDLKNAETRKDIAAAGKEAIQVRCLEIAEKTGKEPGLCLAGSSVALTKPVS